MYEIMFYAGTVLACLFLIISIILFIKNGVWKLMGDVTGLNARRAIKKLDKKGAEDTPNCKQKCSGCGVAGFGGGVCFENKN